MGRFQQAYDAALRASGIPYVSAAAASGINPSTLSRLMADRIETTPQHVEALLRVLPENSDREHCLIQFLIDQTPAEYRERLVLLFGSAQEQRPRPVTKLKAAIIELENAANDDLDLQKLVLDLAGYVGRNAQDFSAADDAAQLQVAAEIAAKKIPAGLGTSEG